MYLATLAFAKGRGADYSHHDVAANSCVEASGEFAEFLTSRGVCLDEPPFLKKWTTAPGMVWVDCDPKNDSFHPTALDHPFAEPILHQLKYHCFNYVNGLCVDWTARQVWTSSPHPLIWVPGEITRGINRLTYPEVTGLGERHMEELAKLIELA